MLFHANNYILHLTSRFQRVALKFNVLLFRLVHILITLVIWQHHFYLKFRLQESTVPKAAPNYYWKLYVCVPCRHRLCPPASAACCR